MTIARIRLPWGEDVPEDVPLTADKRDYCPGMHRNVRLDSVARRVFCTKCGREVDAFEVLSNLAFEYERYKSAVATAKAESMRAYAELEEIKRDLRNAKARKRRAG